MLTLPSALEWLVTAFSFYAASLSNFPSTLQAAAGNALSCEGHA